MLFIRLRHSGQTNFNEFVLRKRIFKFMFYGRCNTSGADCDDGFEMMSETSKAAQLFSLKFHPKLLVALNI